MMEGLKATLLDPVEAIKLFFKQNPELELAAQSKEQIRVGTGIMTFVATRDTLKTQGMGFMEPKDYDAQTDLVMKYIAKPDDKRPTVDSMMTNKYVGGIKLTDAEFDQAQKNSQEFRAYVT
jgi:NitT/TauT family transport system substrate-binding protein